MDLVKYKAVNSAETVDELKKAILLCATDNIIDGRTEKFNVENMCEHLENYINDKHDFPNVLTRNWGIRQQAMYIKFYLNNEKRKH